MKRLLIIFALGLIIGILLLIVQQVFQIPKDVFMHYYWILGAVVVVGAVLFNLFYVRNYQKKMKAAAALLDSGKTDEYIKVVGALRRNAKGRYLKNLFIVNLSAGYCDLKEYGKAIELLESLSDERLYGILKLVHRLNLCGSYFYNHQPEKAMAMYMSSQKEYGPYRESKMYGGYIAVLDVFAAIEIGELSRAKELLEAARGSWNNPHLQDDYSYLEDRLQKVG